MAELQGAKKNEFGKRVLGESEWRRREAAKKADGKGGVRFGKRVVDPAEVTAETKPDPVQTSVPKAETPLAGDPPPPPPSPFAGKELPSIEETERLVREKPELYDDAYQAELMANAPRKGALRLLLRLEQDKPQPRERIIKVLESVIGG